jgi:copper chaperone CopZ
VPSVESRTCQVSVADATVDVTYDTGAVDAKIKDRIEEQGYAVVD